ncbi:MAG: type II toxin-antitoxin system HicA family toxin [Kiritimatiellia bacterium]
MSPKAPKLTGREVIKVLRKSGFEIVRVRGSHHILRHSDGRATVVPVHRGETIGPGLFSKILKDVELTVSDFQKS